MTRNPETDLLLHVARLYYEHNQTQDEIAESLGVSRSKISRLLSQARQEGIVHITIVDPYSSQTQLEQSLRKTFNLVDVAVVAGAVQSEELRRRRIGQAGARYLEAILKEGDRIGIGSGRTLYALTTSLSSQRQPQVVVTPLLGGLGRVPACFQANELARMVAETLGGTWQFLYVPAVLENSAARQTILADYHVQNIVDSWKRLSIAVVGIANIQSPSGEPVLFADFLEESTQQRLRAQGVVGGICVHYFDAQGRLCPELSDRVVGIDLDELRRVPRVIGVAGGEEKVEAILAALRGRYINVLVTDEATAQALLKQSQ